VWRLYATSTGPRVPRLEAMPDKVNASKVVCYIVRDGQLLVFRQLHVHEPTEQRWPSQELHDGHQPPARLERFWIPLRNAHILQAGQGALIGAIFDE
jgi:hypothetical protein